MKTKCIKKWAISIVGVAIVWQALNVLACVASAHADPVAGDWHPATVATGLTATDVAAWAGLALALAIATLKVLAPLTKATWDDHLLERLERLEGAVHGHPAPPPDPPPGPLPAIVSVSGTITTKDGGS